MQTARVTSTCLLFLLVLVFVPVQAKGQLPDEILPGARINMDSAGGAAIAPPASLPDAPAPQNAKVRVRIIDKKFIAVMAALAAAESLRFTTHKLVLEHEYAAGAPWVTSVPRNSHLVVKYGGLYAAELLLAYELKKPHSWLPGDKAIRKLWWLYPSAMAPIHIKNGIRSIRTQGPSGCPPEECGAP